MSMIDTDMIRKALQATCSASKLDETFYDILIPVDDGRDKDPLKIGNMFGVDIIQHPDVPDGQMYIKRKPAANYAPQAMIDDLTETRQLLTELLHKDGITPEHGEPLAITISIVDDEIMEQQLKIQKGPKA